MHTLTVNARLPVAFVAAARRDRGCMSELQVVDPRGSRLTLGLIRTLSPLILSLTLSRLPAAVPSPHSSL